MSVDRLSPRPWRAGAPRPLLLVPALWAALAGTSGCLDEETASPASPAPASGAAAPAIFEEAPVVPTTLSGKRTVAPAAKDHGERECASGARCEGTAPEKLLSSDNYSRNGRRSRGANSQLPIPQNLTLADIDADGVTDFVQTSQNRLFASKSNFDKTGILHLYTRRPIKRVLTGDFSGGNFDQVCLITDDNALACYGISTDRKELWWWFTQGSMIGDNEDSIIGDYNGDGRDDILVYPRGGGAYRMYSITGSYFFVATPSFAPGNLGTATAGLQLRAGDFNADGRDDLAVVNGAGQFLSYSSVFDGTHHTFWWGFTSNGGIATSADQITVARIDDDNDDDIVLRNRTTGATRFYRLEWAGGPLPAISNVSLGQISAAGNSQIFWGSFRGTLSEPGGARREGAIVYENAWNGFVLSDARWSGSALTYWWAYSQYAPNNHAGWSLTQKPWLFLKCKFSDLATTPQPNQFYRDLILGTWGLAHYWRDVSFGAWDVYGSNVIDNWYTMAVSNAAWRALPSRWERGNACATAYGGSTAGYSGVITLVNGEGDAGYHGYVVMTPDSSNSTFLAHEVGHGFGYEHSWDDSGRQAADWSGPGEYWDHWDVMSAMNVHGFAGGTVGTAGPGLNAPYLHKMSFIPAHRRVQLNPTATAQSYRGNLADLAHPEANGPLVLRVGSNNNDHYTIEYRIKGGWDQGIPRTTVLLHRVVNGRSYLITGSGPERLAGSTTSFFIDGKWVYLTVNSFAAAGYTADVSVNY